MSSMQRMDLNFLLQSHTPDDDFAQSNGSLKSLSAPPCTRNNASPTPTAITLVPSWSDSSETSSVLPCTSPPPLVNAPASAIDHLANVAVEAAKLLDEVNITTSVNVDHVVQQQQHLQQHQQLLPSHPQSLPLQQRGLNPISPVSSFHSNYSYDHNLTNAMVVAPVPKLGVSPLRPPTIDAQSLSNVAGASNNNTVVNTMLSSQCSSRMHVCSHCKTPFSLKVRFLHHLLTQHQIKRYDSRTILPCSKCASAFLRNTDRSKHDLCVHQRLRPFRCDVTGCESAFFFEKDLVKHRLTVHLRHKPFRCSICPKAFGKREHMTSHVKRVHHKLRPFRCDVCDIRLASKYNLQGHLKTAAHAAAESLRRPNVAVGNGSPSIPVGVGASPCETSGRMASD